MDSTITLTMGQLFSFLFALLGIGLFAVLFIMLSRVNNILKELRELVLKNEKHIDETMESLPKLVKNIENITGVANEEIKNVQSVVKNVGNTVEYTASAVQELNEDMIEPIRDIFNALSLITGLFPKKRKKSGLKGNNNKLKRESRGSRFNLLKTFKKQLKNKYERCILLKR